VERAFPNLTPVIHKEDQYRGWIDGVTKLESLFTGKADTPWQYRVFLADGTRRVAPEQNLEPVSDAADFPPRELRSRYVESIEGESDLHALGYNLSDMNPDQRRKFLHFCALPMLGPERVFKNLCDILWRKLRGNKPEKIEKYHNAIEQWAHDLDFGLNHPSVDLKTVSPDVLQYIAAVKTHIAKHTDISTTFPLENIQTFLLGAQAPDKESGAVS